MRLGLKIAIVATLIICIFSLLMTMFSSFGSTSPQTPTGIISTVTQTPDHKILVGFGVITPSPKYIDCGVILLPPGNSGVNSSAQPRFWNIFEQSSGYDYNSSIHLEISPPQPNETVGIGSLLGISNDYLVINCSSIGRVPEGKWTLYLTYISTIGPIACATWYVNETPSANHSLQFSRVGLADPMHDYGLIQPPGFWQGFFENGPFWLSVFEISSVILFALIIVQVMIMIRDKGRRVR